MVLRRVAVNSKQELYKIKVRRTDKVVCQAGQALLEHDIVFNKFSCIPSRISQSSIQFGKPFLFSHSLQGLLTKYPISKSNLKSGNLFIGKYFIIALRISQHVK